MSVRIQITNIYGGGDYTAPIAIGSQGVVANVIVDTGSSTLAVDTSKYNPTGDADLNTTAWAQDITYGTGGWAGPVVLTTLAMGPAGGAVSLSNAPLAVAVEQEPNNFGDADGILGLAYTQLNNGYNLHSYLVQKGINPASTWPWPFPTQNTVSAVEQFQQFLQGAPQQIITPYFTLLEQQGVTPNKFALYTLRSMPRAATADPSADPLNLGALVLGGGEEQTDLYDGEFVNVDVVDDLYYNTTLKSVQVGEAAPVTAKPLPQDQQKSMGSNSIVDSGTNSLWLATDVYNAIMSALGQINPQFAQLGAQAAQNPISTDQVNLADWPSITFILAGESGEDVPLVCSPETYWQFDAGAAGQAVFQISDGGLPQSILGLPLMNNYYCVFDRSLDPQGVIRFAPIKLP